MKNLKQSLYWAGVFCEYLAAFTVLAVCIALPFGGTGFWSGYVAWAILLPMLIAELDEETREGLKRWATRSADKDPTEESL